jgi:hypothetical protein
MPTQNAAQSEHLKNSILSLKGLNSLLNTTMKVAHAVTTNISNDFKSKILIPKSPRTYHIFFLKTY